MSNTRKHDVARYARIFQALSNPNRLEIFLRLVKCCEPGTVCTGDPDVPNCVGEVGKDLGLAGSTVSHHLKELRNCGLVHMERQGQRVACWVEPKVLRELADFLGAQSAR